MQCSLSRILKLFEAKDLGRAHAEQNTGLLAHSIMTQKEMHRCKQSTMRSFAFLTRSSFKRQEKSLFQFQCF